MAEEGAPEDSDSQFKDIVKDLFNIEVNTILRDKISAQKMPSVRNALMDIGVEYFEVLEEVEKVYRRAKKVDSAFKINDKRKSLGFYTSDEKEMADEKEIKGIKDELMIVDPSVCEQLGGFQAFTIMRRWADNLLQEPNCADYLKEKKHLLSVLPRIKENADMLKGMFSRICRRELDKDHKDELARRLKGKKPSELTSETVVQESWELEPEQTGSWTNQFTRAEIIGLNDQLSLLMKQSELVMVRKIWEVGTEVIAMQTVIQVDGDVITRLNPNYLEEKVYEKLSDYHNDGVNMALSYWANLVGIAQALLGRLTGK
jgi:hypothetical protein